MLKETYDKIVQCIEESRLIGMNKVILLLSFRNSISKLIEDEMELNLLANGGIDNWEGYAESLKDYDSLVEKEMKNMFGTADTVI